MKIVHLCLACFYFDDWGYQENFLPKQNVNDGHETVIITSRFDKDIKTKKNIFTNSGTYEKNGMKIIRLDYKWPLGHYLNNKIRIYKDLDKHLNDENPDLLFIHGLQFLDLKRISSFAEKHPSCVIFADNHAEYDNSGINVISREILHKRLYARAIKQNIKSISNIYYIGLECGEFLRDIYQVNEKLEFLTLGGNIVEEADKQKFTREVREFHHLDINEFMFLHTGKFNKLKKTLEIIQTFKDVFPTSFKLYLIGIFEDVELEKRVMGMIKNHSNIQYLGWKNQEELDKYLCASDLIVQLGTKSSVFQQGICCGTPLLLRDMENNKFLLSNNNGFLVHDVIDLKETFTRIRNDVSILEICKKNTYEFARKNLSYSVIANHIYKDYEAIKRKRGY